MKYILAIDQGTTSSRVIIYDKIGAIVAQAQEEFPQYFPKPGWVEHDALEIWRSVERSIQKVLTKVSPRSIGAIGITNQRETTVVWDRHTGKPIYNALVWQCRRTANRCNELKKNKKLALKIQRKTGLTLDAYFSATKIEWLLKNVPGAYIRALKGELCFGTTDSWILWNLTGGKTHATDHTNASRTLLYNIEKLSWDKELLKRFAIPHTMLPKVQTSSSEFGQTVHLGKLPAGIPITGIVGDQQGALFGQTCFTPGTVKNTYGTGGFLLMNTGSKRINSTHGLITTLCCDSQGKPAYALEGSIFIAGAAIQWLRDQLKILPNSAASEKLALSIPSSEGVYFVPAFVGLGAPYWDQDARGTITGLTRGTSRAHIVRSALEALCYQTKDVLDAMSKDAGIKISELHVDGGATANNFLCQFQADVLGIPITRPKSIETTSLGAAYLAGLTIGFWKNITEIKELWQKDKTFTPKQTRNTMQQLYQGWQKAIRQTQQK